MEYAVLVLVVGGFAYFVYTRVKKGKKSKSSYVAGGGGGGRTGPDSTTHLE